MHSIRRQNSIRDEWEVVRCEDDYKNGGRVTKLVPVFQGLGCVSAIKLASSLNGGDCDFDELYARVLPQLAVKQEK
jgi:hypothetical protein